MQGRATQAACSSSLDLVLVEEESVLGVGEVVAHVGLRLVLLLREGARMLEELLQDVVQLDALLVLLFALLRK